MAYSLTGLGTWSTAAVAALAVFCAPAACRASELWVGAVEADITPARSVPLDGGMTAPIAHRVGSRCKANVLAVEAREAGRSTDAMLVIACDLVRIRAGVQERFRTFVAPRLPGFDVNKIFLAATHTHRAPVTDQDEYDEYGDGMQPKEYLPFLFERLAEAAAQAWNGRRPGAFAWGLGHAAVGEGRRAVYADGTAQMYGRTDREDFRHLEGVADHTVDCLFFLGADKALIAALVAVPCPAQTDERGGAAVSADFWHDVRETFRARHGKAVAVLGLASPEGNLSPHLMLRQTAENRMAKLRGLSRTQELARRISLAVEETWETAREDIRTDLAFAHYVETFSLPGRKVTEAELADAKRQLGALASKPRSGGSDYWLKRRYQTTLDRFEAQRSTSPQCEVEMHVVRLGDVAIATNPFELYPEYGMCIQGRSPAGQTVLLSFASPLASAGYLPTAQAISAGGYSARVESCPCGAEAGQRLVEKTVASIQRAFGQGASPGEK